jgi:hypothetical protein
VANVRFDPFAQLAEVQTFELLREQFPVLRRKFIVKREQMLLAG